MCQEITKEVQEVIDYVLEHEQNINFKVCTECGRNLPCHDWFYHTQKHGKYGRNSKCKECISILRKNGTYKFPVVLRELYYMNIKDNFSNKFRYMSIEQLQNEFLLDFNEINMLIKRFSLNKTKIKDSLTEEEIIFMYNSLRNNEIKMFSNGIYNHDKYIIIIMKYMINEILKWDRENICKKFSSKTFKENGLGGILGIKKFNPYKYLIKTFPEYNIMLWELRSSSVGNGFWINKENVNMALKWLREKLIYDKGIDNINIAGARGLRNILEEYNLSGLCATRFGSNYTSLFEEMYNDKFIKEEMLKYNYTFEINIDCVPKTLEGKVYRLTDFYNKLDDRGKTLVNEVIRFCENNNSFPNEKDLSNQTGYICRTQFYKYFGENTLKQLYDYIVPVYDLSQETDVDKFRDIIDGQNYNIILIKPTKIKCIKCGEIKEFTEDNFSKMEAQKFGLKYVCRLCDNKYVSRLNYKHKGVITFDEFEDISPEQWWEYVQEGNIRYIPEFCLEKNNTIKIIRYVLLDKLRLTRDDMKSINREFLKKYNIGHLYSIFFKTRLNFLNICFPELEIKDYELDRLPYDEELINSIISNWIKNNNISILNILNDETDYRNNSKIYNMLMNTFISKYDMFIWYFKRNNILHPITNDAISVEDFNKMPPKYWEIADHRIKYVKEYCGKHGIGKYLNDTNLLKVWVSDNFRQSILDSTIVGFYERTGSLYNTLIEAYPEIKTNNILFEWEWHQYSKNDRNSLINMLREFILFRCNDVIINIKEDVPKYLNSVYLGKLYPKFTRQISKNRFDSYYEWGCLTFPEYSDYWTPQMFGSTVAYDGVKCGSKQEMLVYEFAKIDMDLTYFESIGQKRSGEYVFELGEEYEYERFCPDFVLDYISLDSKKIKLNKPIIVEYYGMYIENHKCYIYQNYVKKTKIKNQFYKSRDDIIFVDLYPNDLKNNCEGVNYKISEAMLKNLKHNHNY